MTQAESNSPEDLGGHPLFPRPETATGPDNRKFDLIQIRRWGPDGKMEVCPKTFKGSEIRGWDQIVEMYGANCTYQVAAQCIKTYQFQAFSDKFYFAGPPMKPFVEVTPPPLPTAPQPPPGYHTAPPYMAAGMPHGGTGGNEMLAMMRIMMENNAAVQTAVLKVLIENRQDGGQSAVSVLLKTLLERQIQNPLEVLRDTVPVLQALTGGGSGSQKQFMQGVEFAKEVLGTGGTSKSDDLGELANLIKTFMTVKASAAPTNAAAQPPAANSSGAQPQPATQSAPTRPRKQRKSQPPPTPAGYPAAPPFPQAAYPFSPWPWPYLPAHMYGMMHPAYHAWAAAYAHGMGGGSPAAVPPAYPFTPPPASPPPPFTAPVPPGPVAPTPTTAPVVPTVASETIAPTDAGAEEDIAPAVAGEELATSAPIDAAPGEAVTATVETVSATTSAPTDAAPGEAIAHPVNESSDPFAPLRAFVASLHAPQPVLSPDVAGFPAPFPQPPGFPALPPPFPFIAGGVFVPPLAGAAPDDDDDEDDGDDEDDDEPASPAVPAVIAMAAADPEFETVVPEELRPILRAVLGKSGTGGLS